MSDSLEEQMEQIERIVLAVKGFLGIGIVDYGNGEKIEIAVIDNVASQEVSKILNDSNYHNVPTSIVIMGKTTFL